MSITLAFDPSGNFTEGKGCTGFAYFEEGRLLAFGHVDAEHYDSPYAYWDVVGEKILAVVETVVCESYRLQAAKAKVQTNSYLETPQLIGYLAMLCHKRGIKWVYQHPQDKIRVSDAILERMGVFQKVGKRLHCNGIPTNDHVRDAIRHGEYYFRFGKGRIKDED